MLITNQQDKDFVSKYLGEEFDCVGKKCKSSYFAALEHARELGGRNSKNGAIEKEEYLGSWPSACLYLTLIDHIGNKFAIPIKGGDVIHGTEKNDFLKALQFFTSLGDEDHKTLYQLRCSFLHQFNLYNIEHKGYKNRHFSVHRGSPLITYPEIEFDGNLDNISSNNSTGVSLPRVADLVEEIHKKITEHLKNDELIVNIPSGLNLHQYLKANIIRY
jgi:hypothetical protein